MRVALARRPNAHPDVQIDRLDNQQVEILEPLIRYLAVNDTNRSG